MSKRRSCSSFAWFRAVRRQRRAEAFVLAPPAPARAALLFGTALGVSLAVVAAAPDRAYAGDECGPDTAGPTTLTCAAGAYPGGITYVGPDDLTVVLPGPSTVSGGVAMVGSGSLTFSAPTDTTVNGVGDAVGIVSSGAGTAEVDDVTAVGGSAVVVVANSDAQIITHGAIQADDDGLVAVTGGDALVHALGSVTVAGTGGPVSGITAAATDGVDAYVGGEMTVTGPDDVIGVFANGGLDVTVTNQGTIDVDAGHNGVGVRAGSNTGHLTIDGEGSIEVTAAGYSAIGIDAYGGAAGTGLDVLMTGDIAVAQSQAYAGGPPSWDAYAAIGVRVHGGAGAVNVDVGDIRATGYTAKGVYVIGGDPTAPISVGFDDIIVTTTGSSSGAGVDVFAAAGEEVEVVGDTITTYGADTDGVRVDRGGAAGDTTVEVGTIWTYGFDSDGVRVAAEAQSDVYVSTGSITLAGAHGIGVAASAGGDITVYSGDIDATGGNSRGIVVRSVGGDPVGDVKVTSSGQLRSAYTGIEAYADYGDVTVTNTGSVSTDDIGALAISAYSVAGDVEVDTRGVVDTDGDGAIGVLAVAGGFSSGPSYGYAEVTNSGSLTTSGAGAVGILAGAWGIDNGSGYYGGVTVHNMGGEGVFTSGEGAAGIVALSYFGEVTVDNDARVHTSGDYAAGVAAFSLANNVHVTGSGVVLTDGYQANGVTAVSLGGGVTVDLSGSVTTHGEYADGVSAFSSSRGVDVTVHDVYVDGFDADAIVVGANFDADVHVTGDVWSDWGLGVYGSASERVIVTVDSGDSVFGWYGGIVTSTGEGTDVYNAGHLSAGEGYVIDADGARARIFNTGLIEGAVDLTDTIDLVVNDGEFFARGDSWFGAGNDTFENNELTRVNGTVTFHDLEAFDNDGEITMVDGAANDVFDLSSAVVTSHSLLSIDVDFAGAGTADTLVVGDAAGVTQIQAHAVGATPPSLGQEILVVSSLSDETGAEVALADGPFDAGWVEFGLAFRPAADEWWLVAGPSGEVFEALKAGAASQDFWHKSADAWSGRMRELRDAQAASAPTRGEGVETWAQAHGGAQSFSETRTFDVPPAPYTAQLSADDDWRGFQVGMDGLRRTGSGAAWWGLTTGYTDYASEFDADGNRLELSGFNLGGYAGATWGGFYAEGLVKGDVYEVEANFSSLPLHRSFDGTSWGVRGEAGWRLQGAQAFFEPSASLSWVTSDLDGFSGLGADVSYGDADSLLGRIGARIGTETSAGPVRLAPYLGAYAVEEFDGDNQMVFATGPTSLSLQDTGRGTWGQADFGVNVLTAHGLEGFVEGQALFGGDAEGYAARLGVRWRW